MKKKILFSFAAVALFAVAIFLFTDANAQYAGKTVPGLVNMGANDICQPVGGWCDVSAQQVPE